MSFFKKRPLGLILCIMLGGFSLFTYLPNVLKIVAASAALLILILFALFYKRIGLYPTVISLVALISFGLSFLYFDYYFPIHQKVYEPVRIEGRVTSVIYEEAFGTQIRVKTNEIEGCDFNRASLLVSFSSQEHLRVGDRISFVGTIDALDDTDVGFNEKSYYESRGIRGVVSEADDLMIEESGSFTAVGFISDTREALHDYIMASTDEDTAGMLIALLTGEKDALPAQTRLDFKRIGLSHILAISGMHLAILVTGLHFLLSLFGLGKKLRSVIAMVFVVVYMGLTGFPVSVMRAGIMVLISNLLFLFAKTKDSFTNLMISVALICIITPYAAHDVSLLLSFFATMGVLEALDFMEKRPYTTSKLKRLGFSVLASVISSLFAIAMTLPFSVFNFGRLSYVAPLTTLVFSFLIEIFMYAGSIFLIIGAPGFLMAPINRICEAIMSLSAAFAEIPHVYVISDSLLLKIITVIFYILLVCFIGFRIRRKKTAALLLLFVFSSIFLIGYLNTNSFLRKDRIVYRSDTVENEVMIAVHDGNATAVNLTKNTNHARGLLYYWLSEERIVSLDNLYFPQYTSNLPRAILEIVSTVPVERIYLPSPASIKEREILAAVDDVLLNFRCTCELLEDRKPEELSGLKLYPVYRDDFENGYRTSVSLQMDGEYYTYISDGAIDALNEDLLGYVMNVSRAVIFGCRGSTYPDDYRLDFASEHTDTLIFSSDDVMMENAVYLEYKNRASILYKPKYSLLTE